MTAETLFRHAAAHHQAGRLTEAERGYRAVLREKPDHADALHLLGALLFQSASTTDEPVTLIQMAVSLNDRVATYHANLGNVLLSRMRLSEALRACQTALSLQPDSVAALYNLAAVLQNQKSLPQAVAVYARIVSLKADHDGCWRQSANAHKDLGLTSQAFGLYRTALCLVPDAADALYDFANFQNTLGHPDVARIYYGRALKVRPSFAEALCNLGALSHKSQRTEEARRFYDRALKLKTDIPEVHCYLGDIMNERQADEAVVHFQRALALRPDYVEAFYGLGNVLSARQRSAQARLCYERALQVKPGYFEVFSNLGVVLQRLGKLLDAIALFRHAVVLDPGGVVVWTNFGQALRGGCEPEQAAAAYRRALYIEPGFSVADSNRLFLLSYAAMLEPAQLLGAHRDWYERQCSGIVARQTHGNRPEKHRRLKIGYVSGDYYQHAVSYFIEPIIRVHDREKVEVFCYSNGSQRDTVTERIEKLADGWRSIRGKSDGEAARMIEADGIDILVDLSGHTALNRMSLFAAKPAPVQVTYLGYFTTTGVPAIDYWVTDHILHPEDTVEQTTEQIWRLPRCWVCYQPAADSPEVVPPPSLSGTLTFGSFNALAKITAQTVTLWSKVLRAIPESRLLLKSKGLSEQPLQERICAQFAAHGIPAERISFRGQVISFQEHLAAYGDIDICLDPLPCSGGTTTADALWMGVPVLTLAGATMIGRMSASMLAALGMTEWIAADETDFVAKAIGFAADSDLRAQLRETQRRRMQDSALCDASGLAGALEEGYRAMWERWCDK